MLTRAQVSNGPITQDEYDRAKRKAERAGAKFITKGDIAVAEKRLEHARG